MNKTRSYSQPQSLNSKIQIRQQQPWSKHTSDFKKPSLPPVLKKNMLQAVSQLDKNQFSQLKFLKIEQHQSNRFQKKIQKIEDSFEMECSDRKPYPLCDENAPTNFNNNFKKLDRIQDQNQFSSIPDSITTLILQRQDQLKLFPCRLGIVKKDGDADSIKISGYGNKYMDALGQGLSNPNANHITKINLRRNRINSQGAFKILNNIKQTTSIDFSLNKIGLEGCEQISNILKLKDCKLQELRLVGNLLGDKAIKQLIIQMKDNQSLRLVDLSNNHLTDSHIIHQLLQQNNYLKSLSLRWNHFKCGSAIFEALIYNESLKILDLAYNNLGSCDKLKGNHSCVQNLLNVFKKNSILYHIDLSANTYSLNECKMIAKNLRKNHTIYGFHFAGNYGYVDSRGFLHVQQQKHIYEMHTFQPIIDEKVYNFHRDYLEQVKDPCWICENWQEHTFKYEGNHTQHNAFLHLSYESYKPFYMGKERELTMMIPPSKFRYFLDQDNPQFHQIKQTKSIILQGIMQTSVLPRQPLQRLGSAKKRNIWTFPISVWASHYKKNDVELLKNCFERDWACCHINKFVKNEVHLELIKDMLWKKYQQLKDTYKYLASLYPQGDIWSISWNALTEFIVNTGIVDGKNLKLSDVDLKFIATYSASIEWKGNIRNPERAIIRYQFLEFLVRLAEEKYKSKNYYESTKSFLENISKFIEQYDQEHWRWEKYFIEECDMVCKKYREIFEHIYKRFSSKKVLPGQKRFMCLDELLEICKRGEIINDKFNEREVNLAFNLSMMSQVDELESDRIFQMSVIEFMEAVGRIGEKYYESDEALHIKFERMVIHLLKSVCDDDFQDRYGIPQKSIFEDEFEQEESESDFD